MDGEEDVATFDFSFVAFCFQFRNTQADQSARDATDGCADGGSAEGGHDGAGRDEGANARNGESADADEPAEGAADGTTGSSAGRDAFGGFGVFFMGEVASGFLIGKQDGDVVA